MFNRKLRKKRQKLLYNKRKRQNNIIVNNRTVPFILHRLNRSIGIIINNKFEFFRYFKNKNKSYKNVYFKTTKYSLYASIKSKYYGSKKVYGKYRYFLNNLIQIDLRYYYIISILYEIKNFLNDLDKKKFIIYKNSKWISQILNNKNLNDFKSFYNYNAINKKNTETIDKLYTEYIRTIGLNIYEKFGYTNKNEHKNKHIPFFNKDIFFIEKKREHFYHKIKNKKNEYNVFNSPQLHNSSYPTRWIVYKRPKVYSNIKLYIIQKNGEDYKVAFKKVERIEHNKWSWVFLYRIIDFTLEYLVKTCEVTYNMETKYKLNSTLLLFSRTNQHIKLNDLEKDYQNRKQFKYLYPKKNKKIFYKFIFSNKQYKKKLFNFHNIRFIASYKEINFRIKHTTLLGSILMDSLHYSRIPWPGNFPKFFLNFLYIHNN